MKRVTVTVPDELETELAAFLARQKTPPSVKAVMQTALREFLHNQLLQRIAETLRVI